MQDAVNVFHRALKKKDLKINVRYDEMPKCRDNEGHIPLRPGKQVLNKVRAVSFSILLLRISIQYRIISDVRDLTPGF